MNQKIFIVTNYPAHGGSFLERTYEDKIKEKAYISGGVVSGAILEDDTYVSVVPPRGFSGSNFLLHVHVDKNITVDEMEKFISPHVHFSDISFF